MPLITKLVYNQSSYWIKSDSLTHTFTRFATQSPLPATSGNTAGTVFSLDLGMSLESISVTGLADTIATSGYPCKNDLDTVCRTWWDYTSAQTSSSPQLTIDSGQVYFVGIKQADFKREPAQEDRWSFSMIFLVFGKVSV